MAQTVKQQQNLPTISEVLMSKGAFVEHGDTHHYVDDDFEPFHLSSLVRQLWIGIMKQDCLANSNMN